MAQRLQVFIHYLLNAYQVPDALSTRPTILLLLKSNGNLFCDTIAIEHDKGNNRESIKLYGRGEDVGRENE